MNCLAHHFICLVFGAMLLPIDAIAQKYSEVLFPDNLQNKHRNASMVVWGCELCAKPLDHSIKLDWEIQYEPIIDSTQNLIDSLILDFGATPGFSVSNLRLQGNIIRLSNTKLLVKEGTSIISGLKQIDINSLNRNLIQGKEADIDALSTTQGNKKLFPVLASIILQEKEINKQINYQDFKFSILQVLKKETLSRYDILYEFKEYAYAMVAPHYNQSDYDDLVFLIGQLPNLLSSQCTIQKIFPYLSLYPGRIPPTLPAIAFSDTTKIIPELIPGTLPTNFLFPPLKIPFWPILPIYYTPVPNPPPGKSLICVQGIAADVGNPISASSRPMLMLDGLNANTSTFENDKLIPPFDFIRPSGNVNDPNVIFLFLVPNIESGAGDAQFFLFNRRNQACHIPLPGGLNGSYFVRMKDRYNPRLKVFNVKELATDPDRDSRIEADFSFAACLFDDLRIGIDIKENQLTKDITITELPSSALMDDLANLVANWNTARKPFELEQFRNTYSSHFSPNTITVYYYEANTSKKGIYFFKDIIIVSMRNGGNATPTETLGHELGHTFGLRHVVGELVLDCNYNDSPDATRNENIMYDSATTRTILTLGQIMRMNIRPYSFLFTNKLRRSSDCLSCDENKQDVFYRREKECPCLGLDN